MTFFINPVFQHLILYVTLDYTPYESLMHMVSMPASAFFELGFMLLEDISHGMVNLLGK